jgi:hypothetical protein
MHRRRSFFTTFKAQLKTISLFSGRAFNQRQPPKNNYPCVTVYAASEPVGLATVCRPREQTRTLQFHVSIFIKATQDDEKLEADIDSYTALVESVIKAPAGTNDLQLLDTTFPEIFQDEEKLEVAEITMIYALTYNTTEFSPT